ncbi:hypothetical protein BT93_L5234 [Corymbia citriodora subsp. variegata]|uniref:Uncharacterized protein n=1 Tax=Corymbia citriodora subsp. variegata TaxID=360336 RepID=A0A8T0CSF6_CORYI|nr:hypothetical protein BT93_L5234 [Corymbia citriodora subsp. variegata]
MALWLEWQIKVYVLMVSLCVEAWTSAATPPNSTLAVFEQWTARHGRIYVNNLEKTKRYEIFLKNLHFIEDFNKAANRSYTVGLNQFSDLTTEEFHARYNGLQPMSRSSNSSAATTFEYQNVTQVPDSINWVDKGVVGSIKNQGSCGSCWAFAAVATVESGLAINGGPMLDLSEQQLVDCSKDNGGCKGGWVEAAFQYIKRDGITSEQNYLYKGVEGDCNSEATLAHKVTIQGHHNIPVDEHLIEMAVAAQPVTANIDTKSVEFRSYSGGVFTGPCGRQNLDHSIVIVGYGRSNSDGLNYWLIKNSWGEQWAEKGYMRIQRNSGIREGVCGINLAASHPIM